jgi:hypothetical protein
MQGSNPTKVPKSVCFLHNTSDEKHLATKVKISEFTRGRIINYYCRLCCVTGACRCNEMTSLTMGDIEDLGYAILVKVQDTKNYKSRSFTILGKF